MRIALQQLVWTLLSIEIALALPENCEQYRDEGTTTEAFYEVDPDGTGGLPPMTVQCDFTSRPAIDIMDHSYREEKLVMDSGNHPLGNPVHITYDEPMTQVRALMELDEECTQFLNYRCYHSPIFWNGEMWVKWYNRNGEEKNYWPGGEGFGCKCRLDESCDAGPGAACNCDANDYEWHNDSGTVSNKADLPITQLYFSDTNQETEKGYFLLGPLRCQARGPSPPIVNEDGWNCCSIWGDPHVRRFDGRPHLHFQGICKYNLATHVDYSSGSATTGDFEIHAKFERRHNILRVSYLRYIDAHQPDLGIAVRISNDLEVYVNNVKVEVPYHRYGVDIIRQGRYIKYKAPNKFEISYDGHNRGLVCVAPQYHGHLRGICGNCNGDPYDDNALCNGTLVPNTRSNHQLIGNCHQVDDPQEPLCENDSEPPPACTTEEVDIASEDYYCGQLKLPNSPFKDCIEARVVEDDLMYDACLYDVCATGGGQCDTLLAMAEECEHKGIPVQNWWQNPQCDPPQGDMCEKLNSNPKYRREKAVIRILKENYFSCKAALINRRTAIVSETCVPLNTPNAADIVATPEHDPTSSSPGAKILCGPPCSNSIHVATFATFPNDPGFSPNTSLRLTTAEYMSTHGATNNVFPRLNGCFDASMACAIPKSGADINVVQVPNTVCEFSGESKLGADQRCYRASSASAADLVGQPLLFVHDDKERTPYIHGFIVAVVSTRYLVVDLVAPVANGIGCLDDVYGFWLEEEDDMIDQEWASLNPPECVDETWIDINRDPICGIHPPLCLEPTVAVVKYPNQPCPQEQVLHVDLCKVRCCDDEQEPGCLCQDYGVNVKCYW